MDLIFLGYAAPPSIIHYPEAAAYPKVMVKLYVTRSLALLHAEIRDNIQENANIYRKLEKEIYICFGNVIYVTLFLEFF